MFRFFTTAKWAMWAYLGSFIILGALWVQVQIDVKINEWFGEFYDMIQKALGEPNAVTMAEYVGGLLSFGKLAGYGHHARACNKLPDKSFPVPLADSHG